MISKNLDEALARCASEPIHIPGSVQPHGVLLALRADDLRVEQVSANAREILGESAEDLLGTCFLDHIGTAARAGVEKLIRDAASTYVNPFRVPVDTAGWRSELDAIAHMPEEGITILELEKAPDGSAGGNPSHGLDNYLQLIERSLALIDPLAAEEEVAGVIAREIRAFTGFDRVMVYRFAPDFHGEVIAEAKPDEMEPYLHLHYPASDIPPQARELYRRNTVRLLHHTDAEPSPLVPVLHPRTGRPLDMGRSVLRSMSPVHVQYLRNMGVAATLTLSLVADGRLWGLIACHHRTPRFVPYSVRATGSLYAVVMASQIEAKRRALANHRASVARKAALRILTGLRDFNDLFGSLAGALPDFADLFGADGAAVLDHSAIRTHGAVPETALLKDARELLLPYETDGLFLTARVPEDFPVLAGALPAAAGMVAIHLGEKLWLLVFRNEIREEIRWAGNPDGGKSIDADGRLTPRTSFAAWCETRNGQSRPWDESTITLITELRSGISELIRKRNRLLEQANSELRRFAGVVAHEVKNRLQSGMMALDLLQSVFDDEMDPDLKQVATLGGQALADLSTFTSEMLAFARSEAAAEAEDIDFVELARAAVSQLRMADPDLDVRIDIQPLPMVRGVRTHLSHLITNLVKNAIDHGRTTSRPLEIQIGTRDGSSGPVVFVRDNGRGIPPEDQRRIFDYFYRGNPGGTKGSGIGLAFCAQIVRQAGHDIWVESAPDEGATFCFGVTPV